MSRNLAIALLVSWAIFGALCLVGVLGGLGGGPSLEAWYVLIVLGLATIAVLTTVRFARKKQSYYRLLVCAACLLLGSLAVLHAQVEAFGRVFPGLFSKNVVASPWGTALLHGRAYSYRIELQSPFGAHKEFLSLRDGQDTLRIQLQIFQNPKIGGFVHATSAEDWAVLQPGVDPETIVVEVQGHLKKGVFDVSLRDKTSRRRPAV